MGWKAVCHRRPPADAVTEVARIARAYRAAEQLRQVLIELRIAPIQAQAGIPTVWAAFDDQGQIRDVRQERAADMLLDELVWWTAALKAARDAAVGVV